MPSDQLAGRQIGDYTVIERIGRGGMASVYRAHQKSVNRDVALKVIQVSDNTLSDDHFRRRFAREARLVASLEHIHILPIYDYGIDEDVAYLAMRLLRGGSVSDRLKHGPLPVNQAVTLFVQVARALHYAHSKGVIHRDIKPSNIMLDDEGNASLTDFGLAKIIEGSSDITKSGNIVGTPAYMSPEQLRGDPLDRRTDVYSLGVVLYQMLTGKPPFEGTSSDVIAVIYKHLETVPDPPSKVNHAVPQAVDSVVMRALSKDREGRFDNALDMAQALQLAVGLTPAASEYSRISLPSIRARPWVQALPRPVLYVLPVILLALAAALALVVRGGGSETVHDPTVLVGQAGTLADVTPTTAEVQAARRRLGDRGFVAVIACNRTSEYHATITREIVDFIAEFGLASRVYDANNDSYSQITLIEQARSDGATGMIICPLDIALLDAQLRSLDEADMPLVLFTAGENRYGGVIMTGDNYPLGLVPGRYAGRLIRDEMDGQADVIILDYPSLPEIVDRADGLQDGLLELAPEANIIGRYLGATRENGYATVQRLIADGVTFDVILSINDAGAFGAIQALDEAGIPPDEVIIVSVDAEALAQQYIREGYYMRGSVAANRTGSAQAMAYTIVKLLAGGTVPEQVLIEPGDMVTRESLEAQPGG